ncbi:MAG TPA: OsmC family protein [Longimicrobiales bacterium]|nr:OsmC family protein [Longimicrobiales bacterium]
MLGTLNGALEVRGVKLPAEAIQAEARGYNEVRGGVPVLTRIHVHYTLRIPAGTREAVDRALARHRDRCPTAVSLGPAVQVDWTADIEEVD